MKRKYLRNIGRRDKQKMSKVSLRVWEYNHGLTVFEHTPNLLFDVREEIR